jgi:ABC-type nitrate/sulfonate/bicarbonate transport system permease component
VTRADWIVRRLVIPATASEIASSARISLRLARAYLYSYAGRDALCG